MVIYAHHYRLCFKIKHDSPKGGPFSPIPGGGGGGITLGAAVPVREGST